MSRARDQPVGLAVVDATLIMVLTNRLLDVLSAQLALVEPQQGVIGPLKALDRHRMRF
jgi:hypothetical protein